MAKKKKKSDSDDSSGKSLRNLGIFAASAAGKTQGDIADDYGISRSQVNRVLSSSEAKRLVDQGRGGLLDAIGTAVDTLIHAMEDREKNMGVAVNAAIQLLKGVGVLTEKTEVVLTKPFIYEAPDGGQIVMGHKQVSEEEE